MSKFIGRKDGRDWKEPAYMPKQDTNHQPYFPVVEIRQIQKMKVFEFVDRGTWSCSTVIIGAPDKAYARKILRKWINDRRLICASVSGFDNYKECKEIKSLTCNGKTPRVIRNFNEGD